MIVDIESALVSYYTTRLGADATLANVDYAILAATGDEPPPQDVPVVFVTCTETPQRLQVLIDAVVETRIAIPVDVSADATGVLRLLERAVVRAFDQVTHPTATADLNTLLTAAVPDYSGGGYDAQGWTEDRRENMMAPIFRLHVGLVRED